MRLRENILLKKQKQLQYGKRKNFVFFFVIVWICSILKMRKLHGLIKSLTACSDNNYLGHNNLDFR